MALVIPGLPTENQEDGWRWLAARLRSRDWFSYLDSGSGPYHGDPSRGGPEPTLHELAHWVVEGARRRSIDVGDALARLGARAANIQEAKTVALEIDGAAVLGLTLTEAKLVPFALEGLRAMALSDAPGQHDRYGRWFDAALVRARATKAHRRRVRRFVEVIANGCQIRRHWPVSSRLIDEKLGKMSR